jgi:twitching motility protein PilT
MTDRTGLLETSEAAVLGIDEILRVLVDRHGSDLHLKVGRPPLLRIDGELRPMALPVLTAAEMAEMLKHILGRQGLERLEADLAVDAPYVVPGVARFRVNAYKELGEFGAALRAIPLAVPTLDSLGLPATVKDLCHAPQGLVLVTGPSGSGKSTTLAAMVEHLNRSEPLHVVTIEDPVEFVYKDRECTISQRQLGSDVHSLPEALRQALRQDPDVILLGEIRDRETLELAMRAAETGHLIFSTLHTNDARQTLDRIIEMYPLEAAPQVRALLALTLKAVISQRLVRRAGGTGRVAALEILVNSPHVRDLITTGRVASIQRAIEGSGAYYGMQTLNQSLARLVLDKVITRQDALGASINPTDLELLLKGIDGSATLSRPQAFNLSKRF